MALTAAEAAAVDRLGKYNGDRFDPASNPTGLAGEGYKSNGPAAWNDTSLASGAVAREAAAAVNAAGSAAGSAAAASTSAANAAGAAAAAKTSETNAATSASTAAAAAKAGGNMTGALGILAGTAAAPGLYVVGDTDTGISQVGGLDTLSVIVSGGEALRAARSGSSTTVSVGGAPNAEGLLVLRPANAVNRITVSGSATGGQVYLAAQGADANVPLAIYSKGRSNLSLCTGGDVDGPTQLVVVDVAAANRAVTVQGSNGGSPRISTTAGALELSSALGSVAIAGNMTVYRSGVDATLLFSGDAGRTRSVRFASASAVRWDVGTDGTGETGGNAGSDFFVSRYTDAGALIDTPLKISRANGASTFARATRASLVTLAAVSNIFTMDCLAGNEFDTPTLGANVTFANPANPPASGTVHEFSIRTTQDQNGNRTLSFGPAWKGVGNITPNLNSGKVNLVVGKVYSDGTVLYSIAAGV